MKALNVETQLKSEISKKLFKLNLPNSQGVLLNIYQTSDKKSTRFIHCDFQAKGNLLAIANNDGQIYIVDFLLSKFWKLKRTDVCTCIKLSELVENQLLVGKLNGVLEVLDVDSGEVLGKLLGHEHPVLLVSFSDSNVCMSSSKYEAIIWDLTSYCKLQVLSLEKDCALKFVVFVPISNHILVCYQDDIIQIWQNGSFDNLKQFHPSNWRNHSVKSLSFSRNGKIMAVSGYLPILAIFQLDIWKLLKIINLPDHINTVKKIQFIPQNFDAGCNKLLAILSSNGTLYFYNVEDDILVSELKSDYEISNFSMSCKNVHYISCLLGNGEVEVYDVHFYTLRDQGTVVKKALEIGKVDQKTKLKNFCRKDGFFAKIEMQKILEIDKLKSIIKEYQEFPQAFRATIWEKILQLPNNIQQYNSIVNYIGIQAFPDLHQQFPLEDKVAIRCLRHVLNNIATWCPFFAMVEFLPCFLFPFVKVFHKKPIACFELCCTIIVNWCQHWFEYHPLPPVNVLAIIDNMLMEHDAQSLQHFSQHNIKPIIYSWSLLESAFSEVLTASEWLIFWDHVFINEPAFLLCAIVAFIMLQKKHFLLFTKEDEFEQLFHTQKPLELKNFIKKSYLILSNTSEKNHPRQYLAKFTCLTCGSYPSFEEYPKEVVEFQVEHVNYLDSQLKETKNLKDGAIKERERQALLRNVDVKNEEDRRMIEVEKACIEKIKSYQKHLIAQQEELQALRKDLNDQEQEILKNTQKNLKKTQRNAEIMNLLANGLDMSEHMNEIEINNLEEAYKIEGLGLSRKNRDLQGNSSSDTLQNPKIAKHLSSAHQETLNLKKHLRKAKHDLNSPRKADIALTISAMNNLIKKIQSQLDQERFSSKYDSVKENLKVHELEKETSRLQTDISQLVRLITSRRGREKCFSSCSSQMCCNKNPNKFVRFSTTSDY